MAPSGRVDAFQRRHTWVGFPVAVIYKFNDDQGSYLAALLAYYGFVSLFPVLLLLTTVLGIVLQRHPSLQQDLLNSAFAQFPVVGARLPRPEALKASTTGIVVSSLVALYGALGVAQAAQHAMNTVWAVPRNTRGNPLLMRGRSVLLLLSGGLLLLGTFVLSSVNSSGALSSGLVRSVLVQALTLGLNVLVLLVLYRVATATPLRLAEMLPGATVGAVVWRLLQIFGPVYIKHVVNGSSESNGTFSLVLGLLAWIYLLAVTFVLSAQINVVVARRLHPRSLLTPFTDDVDLTHADRRAYTQYAAAQRNKGFEQVDVTFEHDGQNATAKRRRRAGR